MARGIQRKIIFHAGPTNSGKTHHALESFLSADNGIYCGPLKLLASEVFLKSNAAVSQCCCLVTCSGFSISNFTLCGYLFRPLFLSHYLLWLSVQVR